jgi:hypothetical protein
VVITEPCPGAFFIIFPPIKWIIIVRVGMDGTKQYRRVVIKNFLGTITVMIIDIQDGDFTTQVTGGDGGGIKIAEASIEFNPSMMSRRAAKRMRRFSLGEAVRGGESTLDTPIT